MRARLGDGELQSSCQVGYTPNQVGTGVHTIGAGYSGGNRHEASQGTATVGVSAAAAGTGGSVQGTTSAPNTRLGKKPPKRSTKRVRQVHVLVERAPCHFRMQARQEAVRSLCVAVQKEGEARAACLPGTGGEQRRDRRPVPCGLSLEGPAGLRGLNRKGGCNGSANANGLPSESRQTAQRSPGWTIEPPSSWTRYAPEEAGGQGHVNP